MNDWNVCHTFKNAKFCKIYLYIFLSSYLCIPKCLAGHFQRNDMSDMKWLYSWSLSACWEGMWRHFFNCCMTLTVSQLKWCIILMAFLSGCFKVQQTLQVECPIVNCSFQMYIEMNMAKTERNKGVPVASLGRPRAAQPECDLERVSIIQNIVLLTSVPYYQSTTGELEV